MPVTMSAPAAATVAPSHASTSHGPTRPKSWSSLRSRTKPTGTISSVSRAEVTSPPMTIVANGGQISFSRPVARARGQSAATVVAVVINTGRVRSRTAARAAAPSLHPPPSASCCMRSTSRIAGFTVRPKRVSAPSIAIMSSGMPASTRAHDAPSRVSGSAKSTSTGRVSDSKVMASTRKSRATTGSTMRRNQLAASSCPGVSTAKPMGRGTIRTAAAIRSSMATRLGPVAGTSPASR